MKMWGTETGCTARSKSAPITSNQTAGAGRPTWGYRLRGLYDEKHGRNPRYPGREACASDKRPRTGPGSGTDILFTRVTWVGEDGQGGVASASRKVRV